MNKTDEEKVLERLSWRDDDIVAEETMATEDQWFPVQRSGPRDHGKMYHSNNIKSFIRHRGFRVLKPFLSNDGVLFTPEDSSR